LRRSLDASLNDDVGRAADQKQVLDIVTPHQNQFSTRIDRQDIRHGQTRRAIASAAESKPASTVDPHCHAHQEQ
jgi:hypothetical protein